MRKVCEIYADVSRLHEAGAHVISTDEKTSIQAVERFHPTLPTRPGLTERKEFEYARHSTLCLIANFDVATGMAIVPTIGPTRTEDDFAAPIERTIDTDPDASWVVVLDPLNTHKSVALVRLVAQRCYVDDCSLGTKGNEGVLETMVTSAYPFARRLRRRLRSLCEGEDVSTRPRPRSTSSQTKVPGRWRRCRCRSPCCWSPCRPRSRGGRWR